MVNAFEGIYLIRLDADKWGWGENGFDFDAIPIFFKLDSEGRPSGEVIDGGAWGENIPKNMAPPLDEFFHGR